MKQKKNLWVNLLFAAVVLVIAGVLFYLRSAGQSGSTLGAELIYGDANTVQKISLDKDAVYDIDTGYLTVHIEVKDGAARWSERPVPAGRWPSDPPARSSQSFRRCGQGRGNQ